MKNLLLIGMLGAIAAALAYASYKTTRWGGSCGYHQIEHELTFVDPNGNPVEGVELRVEDQLGNEFFCFPVSDYLPGKTPTSDKDGVMQFHHVSTAFEWDNYGWSLFWFFPIQTTSSPVYVCRFLRAGKEVYRVRYDDLPSWDWPGKGWEQVPKVKRTWNRSAMIPNEIKEKAGDTEESYYGRMRLFFHNKVGESTTRESGIAMRNAQRLLMIVEGTQVAEEIEFPVIRRTIRIEP